MSRGKRSILIVDSSASSVFYTGMLLRNLRYAVESVTRGEDALRAIAGSAPAAVITDIALPGMSGIDLLKQLKKNTSLAFIPVIIHTADGNAAIREACVRAGCAAFFAKPVQPEPLYRAIQSATEATPRQKIRINTALKVRIDPGDAVGRARIEDVTTLSEGGLSVSTTAPEPLNALVRLTLLLGAREIRATGKVLYNSPKSGELQEPPGMGMKFTEISAEDVGLIREFIRAEVIRDLEGRGT